MSQSALIERLRAARVVPVVRTGSAVHAETAVEWLRAAGISIFEITMTIPGAVALISRLSVDKDLLIGAGTVPDEATARACLDAGARFLVAPWVDPTLSAPCRNANAALMLGAFDSDRSACRVGCRGRRGQGVPCVLGGRTSPHQGPR